ncbi:uncharacterized protein SOCG_04420 [Schizosaccharomyces octosporus yFS286]|uniref:GPN-loop GTPase n=1 Tax=Schizosaccharomyces octosporus (strain yFS286) TaxID=483514 RepID=S9RAL9_SCHOY|nr:uncharacterized protein SOCG_04420 [Schizosaccharomyces octosporus yFS286]EPX75175.1 hypothetical protein SOCG_04420 [Schizosaccharomyces octosporus yFS286]
MPEMDENVKKPSSIIVVGMAGSGKTTFLQQLNAHLHSKENPPYIVNLDPAVKNLPYEANIDIRDTINYKEVMKQYKLGPNGGIMTSLNLFVTKFDQVLKILEKRAPTVDHILIDTPGQIEIFQWSASGSIISDTLASSWPTCIAYVVDTPRSTSTSTFMSSMLYACSMLYKTKLPLIIVFNKCDVQDAEFAKKWMLDFEEFQQAIVKDEGTSAEGATSGYMGSLVNSMSLMLEEFYRHLDFVSVSSVTGEGMDDFLKAVDSKAEEYKNDYLPEIERLKEIQKVEKEKQKEVQLSKLMKDMHVSKEEAPAETISDAEEDEYDGEYVEPDEEEPTEEAAQDILRQYRISLGISDDVSDEKLLELLTEKMRN